MDISWHLVALEEVQCMLNELCSDSRFSFLGSAFEHFSRSDYPRNELSTLISDILSLQLHIDVATRANRAVSLEKDHIDSIIYVHTLLEIIDSIIYEVLDVFGFDMTPQEIPTAATVDDHLECLKSIYKKSQSRQPQPVRGARSDKPGSTSKSTYQYPSLGPTTETNIRILNIFGDTEQDSPIRCDLEVCNLNQQNAVPEALSYVWGVDQSKDPIFISGNPFFVTKNLHTILRGLRRRDVNRRIWVDAICIDQSNLEEKTHQVRLMRDIYTKAGATIIWLNERHGKLSKEDQALFASHPGGRVDGPLPRGYGGFAFDQYDLVAILNECMKYPADTPRTEKSLIAYSMLDHCKNGLWMNEWWRRVWTLQEATLPPKAPTIHYRGHSFSFDDIIEAVKFLRKANPFGEESEQILARTRPGSDLYKAAIATKTITSRILDSNPIALEYRPGLLEDEVGQARRSVIESFTGLLAQTSQVKATNPRDKVFALESLLPKRCLGRLINVDYSEDVSDVFRRATARSFNSSDSGQLYLMVRFNFLFESQLRKGEELSGPSWVLDLTYSDAALRSNKVGNWRRPVGVTLDGYLYQNRTPEDNNQVPCRVTFATPESLYCAGCSIDQVRWVAEIPALTIEHASKELLMFAVKINLERRIILGLGVPSDYVDHLTIPTNPDVIQITSSMRFLSLLADEDSLEDMMRSVPFPREHRLPFLDIFLQERNFNLAGKTCFITQRGLVGIATSPIRPGDKLCWVNTALVYLVLRDACNDNEGANSMHKHRIVARAAVSEKQSMMQTIIQSSQVQGFQIV